MRWISIGKDIACISCFTGTFYLSPVLDAALTNKNSIGNSLASSMNLSLLTALGIWVLCMLFLRLLKEDKRRRIRLIFLFISAICIASIDQARGVKLILAAAKVSPKESLTSACVHHPKNLIFK